MRILIADDDLKLASTIARSFTAAGHAVEVVRGGARVIERMTEEPADLLVLDWLLDGLDGMAVVRYAKEKLASRPVVMMLSSLTQNEAKLYALKNGVDEFLTKPTNAAALFAGLQAAIVTSVRGRAKTELRPNELRLVTTPFWMSVGQMCTGHLRGCTAILELEARHEEPSEEDLFIQASLGMLDSEQHVELDLTLSCSRASGLRVAHSMLHMDEVDDESIAEMLSELCNNLLGFAKANLRGHGFAFTLRVPEPITRSVPPLFSAGTRAVIVGPGVKLVLDAGIRPPSSYVVKLRELKENMILLEDVKNDSGALLLPAGTRITAAAAHRMANHGQEREVRVAPLVV